ncbi:M43 family zinc metalloprotease [Arcticibacterium luteifluviistationis]|uniref:Uncharacterized protein n=1 Tax=Arcticibacterium luteifluviistationis TaxID=1784714 RepID=A0A2Z4GAQ4_9BACT|nr:M43 family zinc metalloprotease [Arcticibacterium luteifluviistationis]AWV98224.1 hypothetical protein DJ013_08590 [Arcticibacterium luteifluviistationis]
MKMYWIGAFIALMTSFFDCYSQSQPCAADFKHAELLKNSDTYRANFETNQTQIDNFINNQTQFRVASTSDIFYRIPLVVHVLEPDSASSIVTDVEINQMISRLNNQLKAGAGYTESQNINIEFVLAKRSPDCGATTGIVRVDMSSNTSYVDYGVKSQKDEGISDLDAKSSSNWGNTNYYNLWIVNEIDGKKGDGVIGYAYFPGAGADVDGALMIADQLKKENSTLLVHELGHALGVYHTFQGYKGSEESGYSCTSNVSPTTQGDRCADTDPMHFGGTYVSNGIFNCETGYNKVNPCTGKAYGDLFRNIMNYVPDECAVIFTQGQKDRMRATLIKARSSLLESKALDDVPAVAMAPMCAPNIGSQSSIYYGITLFNFDDELISESGTVAQDGYFSIDNSCYRQVEVSPDSTYPVIVKTKSSNYVKVYIDYNNDGDFEDHGEEVGSNTSPSKTFTFNYTVPSSGVLTNQELRMRVVCDPSYYLNACSLPGHSSYGSGQSEDYGIKIKVSAARPNPCLSNVILTEPLNDVGSGLNLIESLNSIVAGILISGGHTILHGADNVVLNPGFEVSEGAVFTAEIKACDNE